MRLFKITLAIAATLAAVPAQAQAEDPAFTKSLHRLAEQLDLPGFSVAVVRDGKIVYRHREGVADRATGAPVRADSLFGIASVTKTMTGIILAQLEAEGKNPFRRPACRLSAQHRMASRPKAWETRILPSATCSA